VLYINLHSPTSGSKERNKQTYKYGEKATKEKNWQVDCKLASNTIAARHSTIYLHAK